MTQEQPREAVFAARHFTAILVLLCMGSAGCGDSNAANGDGGTDAFVGPCPGDAERQMILPDADDDGFGVLQGAEPTGCLRRGFIPMPSDLRFDCDDDNAAANPDAPQHCDFDADGTPGVDDCDDQNRRRAPTLSERCNGYDDDCDGLVDDADQEGAYAAEHNWGLDQDGDQYPSAVVFSCADPGGGYVHWRTVTEAELDCAPLDPDIHPFRHDDCATSTDANCDGEFTPVYAANEAYRVVRDDIAAAFTSVGPDDAPTNVLVDADGLVIDVCPGTYRVHVDLLGNEVVSHTNRFTIRGHGASPADVVLDAAASDRNVTVHPSYLWEQGNYASRARLENLTLTRGRAPSGRAGGCVAQLGSPTFGGPFDGVLDLDRVVFRDCEARDGGAVAVEPTSALVMTDVIFEDTHAVALGGGVYFLGTSLSMTGGSFENASAPSGGAAIAAVLAFDATLTLQSVDLSAVSHDLSVESSAYNVQRDLGAGADLVCTVTAACTP